MSFEQELGSIMSHFYQQFNAEVYTMKMPQDFQVPSLYFPPPITFDTPFTAHSFEKNYSLTVKLFHEDEQKAFTEAEKIADSIRKSRKVIPIINADTSSAGRMLIVSNVDVRVIDSGPISMGVAQITIAWKSRYNFDFPTYEKIQNVYGRFLNKNDETI